MRIIWSPLAVDRVSAIAEYIAQDNPTAAENWVNTVFTKVEQLKSFPESWSNRARNKLSEHKRANLQQL